MRSSQYAFIHEIYHYRITRTSRVMTFLGGAVQILTHKVLCCSFCQVLVGLSLIHGQVNLSKQNLS